MNRPPLRMTARALAGVLATTLLLFAPTATSTATAAQVAADSGAASGEKTSDSALVRSDRVGRWMCGSWKRTSPNAGSRWCVRFRQITPKVQQDGQDLLHNSWNRTRKMHCSLTRGTTLTFHAQATVKAEAGVIFAKAETSVTAGVARSTTTTSTVGTTFPVKPKRWAYCARGHAYFRVVGSTRKQVCASAGCRYFAGTRFNTKMPSSPFFDTGPGKNIDWAKFLPAD